MKPSRHLIALALVALVAPAVAAACAPASPPRNTTPTPTRTAPTTSGVNVAQDSDALCDLVLDRPHVDETDFRAKAVEDAEEVLKGIEGDLLACYKKRVAVSPQAHGYITVDVIIGQEGKVQGVETTGGAILGDATMGCIVDRIKRASFAPPHKGGTLRVHVPFALRRVAPAEAP